MDQSWVIDFVQRLFVPIPTLAASPRLFGRELRVGRGAEVVSRMIKDDDELQRVLAETIGLGFPPSTRGGRGKR